jgi:hypothetical protein
MLLGSLAKAGDPNAVTALAARATRDASLSHPGGVARLLHALRAADNRDAVAALLARDPARHASLDDPADVARLLQELAAAGDRDPVTALLARDPAGRASLNRPWDIARLLQELATARDGDPAGRQSRDDPADVAVLHELATAADREAVISLLLRSHTHLGTQHRIGALLEALRGAGDCDPARALADAANAGMFDLFLEAYPDEASGYKYGREPDEAPSQPWEWQEPTS